MVGSNDDEPGVSLSDALECWTPQELWQRYREIADHDIPLVDPWIRFPTRKRPVVCESKSNAF